MDLTPSPSLVGHLRAGRCVLFAGAGLSAWAQLPTWGKLLEALVAEVRAEGLEPEADELMRLLADQRYLEVADWCKERLGQRFYEILRPLRGGDGPISEPHRLVLRLPFAAWVTTNYDKLLEAAYAAERGGAPRVLTQRDGLGTLLFDGAPFILKAHGDIDRPDTVVLTARDYSALIQGNPSFNAMFSALLLTKAILFVGYSLTDPDFRLLLDRQLTLFGEQVPDRWALMSGVGPVQRDLLWRTARIKVLSYPAGEHAEVLTFLRYLARALGLEAPTTAIAGSSSEASDRGGASHGPSRPLDANEFPSPPDPALQDLRRGAKRIGSPAFAASANPPLHRAPATPEQLPPHTLVLDLALGAGGITASVGHVGEPPLAQGEVATPASWAALARIFATLGAPDPAARDFAAAGRALAGCLPVKVLETLANLEGYDLLALHLVPELETLPWEILQLNSRPLALVRPLVRLPVGVAETARGYRPIRRPARALLIGDPTEYLPGARHEIEALEALYRQTQTTQVTRLLGREATAESLLAAIDKGVFDIVHFAGHAWYDAQEVYLALAGNEHLTASDLRPALSRHPPAVLFLNSHFTAFVPPGVGIQRPDAVPLSPTPGGRPGFTHLAARTGVGALIGCFGSPADVPAAELAMNLHQQLIGGATIAEALFRSRSALAMRHPEDPTSLLYVLSGAAHLRIPAAAGR